MQITKDIKNLKLTDEIVSNLFFYKYHSRYLKKLQQSSIDKDDPHYISTYSSFIGEVYENIIYELLLIYAIKSDEIKEFVLKGPHQNSYQNHKNGLMIDANDQIVYKAKYKDVTEFDGLFFTKGSVWFVESTIVKTTTSLRKRLKKKKALLEVLFPKLTVKSLVILTQGALGTTVFPSYATVWITKPLDDKGLIEKLIYSKKAKHNKLTTYDHKKLIYPSDVRIVQFRYFDTLKWILKESRKNRKDVLDFRFLLTNKLAKYFDIFSKLYIGYIDTHTLIDILKYFNIINITDDIPLNRIENDMVIVTIEKTKDSFELIYYLKVVGEKLKKLNIDGDSLVVTNKDPKGFTAAETKYMRYIFKYNYKLKLDDIKIIEERIQNNNF